MGNLCFKLSELAYRQIVKRKFTVFVLFYSVFEANFQVQAPRDLYSEGAIKQRVFCITSLGGLYLEELIFGILWYFYWLQNELYVL